MAIIRYPEERPDQYRIVYPLSGIKDLVEEANHRTVKLLQDEQRRPLIAEYAIDWDSALMQSCFVHAIAAAVDELRYISHRSEEGGEYGDSKIIIPFAYSTQFRDADMGALDEALKSYIVYKTLHGWYEAHSSKELSDGAATPEAAALAEVRSIVRRMAQDWRRPPLRNPFANS